ncbi:MAG: FkbM family methyltransferase [Chitinophagaceae bacterium]|nr:FkbM family methyltransferase [Chitinophagaceae bacterium]
MTMQKDLLYTIPSHPLPTPTPLTDLLLRQVERIRLQKRAEKYQFKEDRGGIAYIRKAVQTGNTVFDIGAHKGGYLYFFLQQLQYNGAIYAFEPQSVLYQYLKKMQRLFNWQQVTIEPMAVSDRSGKAMLCVPYNGGRPSSPCATIIESKMAFDYQAREEVDTISLDTYCSTRQVAPDFLKVDVEGNELSVFTGAQKLLHTLKPRILFECEARFVGEEKLWETFRLLQQAQYKGYFIMQNKLLPVSAFSISRHQDPGAAVYCNNFIFE